MSKLLSRLVFSSASGCCLLMAILVSARGQQMQAPDPERAFAFGDTNLDGKLSFDEFRELIKNPPRLKKAAAKRASFPFEPVFQRLDRDGDGFLTVQEFRGLAELRQRATAQQGLGPMAKRGLGASTKAPAGTKAPVGKAPSRSRFRAKPAPAVAGKPVTPDQAKFFETKIRPVLMTTCAKCHGKGSDQAKGGLRVDIRDGLLKGGDTGSAVVPGNLEESLLIRAIRYEDESLRMPPKTKLRDEVIADFEKWVQMGAPDPRGSEPLAARGVDVGKGRQFWAFQPPRASSPPQVKDASWPTSDIDRFLLAALEAKGLRPRPDVDRRTLLRRVTFDLTGLPPSPEEVSAFAADQSPTAFAKVVDRLLDSPRFGERWGRHWLDVARFAESSGKANMTYPEAWRYRDWVIAAFNSDKRYDEFVAEQIAGDLLPAKTDIERAQAIIATGFLAIGSKTHNTQNRQQFLLDLADEQIDATSQAFLGLTIACARCHDHKFDPISQLDYYALSGIFQSTQTCYGTLPGVVQNNNPSPLIELPLGARQPAAVPRLSRERRAAIEKQLDEFIKVRDSLPPDDNFTLKGFQNRTRIAMLRFRLASYRSDGTPRAYAMGVRERFEPIDSPLYVRGELDQPDEPVRRGLVPVICQETPPPISRGSGRRELAGFLASPANPLTARVMVNRIWLHLFGRGLVPTPDNFGAAGQPPSHPELLDTLAVWFMRQEWSVKRLIRRIVVSRAYQLSSSYDAASFDVDPDNAFVWRINKKRLEAEAIRDAILFTSGNLILEPPVGSAVARAGEGRAGPLRGFDQDSSDFHRAVYLPVVRDQLPESLTVFDFADPSLVTPERTTTSGPSQSLYLMNNRFVIGQAEAAADRVCSAALDEDARIDSVYLRFLARTPSDSEKSRAREFLSSFSQGAAESENRTGSQQAAWTAFCQAVYASAEFRYLD